MNAAAPEDRLTPAQHLTVWGLFLAALLVRLVCLPHTPFFADVPDNVDAIESGRMRIQFPGYVPFHLVVVAIRSAVGDAFSAMVVFSMLCGVLAWHYSVRTAAVFGGFNAAVAAAVVAGFGLIGTYFSVVGSSYTTDLIAAAGATYHGLAVVRRPDAKRHILWAVIWCCFGFVMRPLSGMWLLPGALYLAWAYGGFRERRSALGAIALTMAVGIAVSAPYYGTFADVLGSATGVHAVATDVFDKSELAAALARLVGFPFYFFHLWLVLAALAVWRARRRGFSSLERRAAIFLLVLTGPYCLVLVRHIPQAGYLCLVAPMLIGCPFIFSSASARRRHLAVAIAFAAVSLGQLFLLKPVPPTDSARVVADAYFLQYSRAAIKEAMFETLASLALKTGVLQEEMPEERREDLLRRQRNSERAK